ncbi:MAG: Peptidase M23 family protein, partial [Microgenomates group bacterium LiPW_31]
GGIAGGVIGYKIGGLVGAAIGGPVGMIIGGTIGFILGIFAQFIWDKITAAISSISLPQIGTAGLTQASVATTATAGWFAPAAVATATIGGLIISQVVSGAFFIPSEEVMLTSPYIQVTKTVEFSGTIGDSINYTIQVKAVDKDLTKVKIVDQATATCRGSSPDLDEHSWDGSISIPAGGVWEKTYTVTTSDQFNDCLINNTARVTAIVEGKTEESFAVGYVSIGNPPEVIPWGLPIHDNPDRGPGYTFGQITDEGIVHQGIDVHGYIGPDISVPVYSTFPSESRVIQIGFGEKAGNYIMLSLGKYQIFMGHLAQKPNFKIDDPVGANAPVGIQGDSGHSFGEHVHYQIWENGVIVDPRSFGVRSPPW